MFWNKKEDKTGLPDLPPIKSPFSKELMPAQDNLDNPEDEKITDNQPLPTFPDSPSNKGFSQSAIKEAVSDRKEINSFVVEDNTIASGNNQDNFHIENEERPQMQEIKEDLTDKPTEETYETSITSVVQPKKVTEIESSLPHYEEPAKSQSSYLEPSLNLPIGLPPEEEKIVVPKKIDRPQTSFQERPITQVVERPIVERVERVVQYERPAPPAPKNADIYVKIDKFMSAKKSLISIKDQVSQIDDLLKKIRETKLREERELSIWEKEIFSIKEKIRDVNDNIFDRTQ